MLASYVDLSKRLGTELATVNESRWDGKAEFGMKGRIALDWPVRYILWIVDRSTSTRYITAGHSPPFRRLESSNASLQGTGKRSFLVPKEFRRDQGLAESLRSSPAQTVWPLASIGDEGRGQSIPFPYPFLQE